VATYLLWDIDGTLIVNDFTGVSIYARAFERTTGAPPTERPANPHGMTEGQLLRELLAIHGHDVGLHDTLRAHLDELSVEEHEVGLAREQCAGAADALARFAEQGWHNGLLTGNAPERARFKMLQAGYGEEPFGWEHSFFGHLSADRHHLTSLAATGLAGHRVVIIGDTPMDGVAAVSANPPPPNINTNSFTANELLATNTFVAVESFATGLAAASAAIAALPEVSSAA
jgi:phosphoglycolate phosphatase